MNPMIVPEFTRIEPKGGMIRKFLEKSLKRENVVCLFLHRLKTPQINIVTRALHFSCIYVTLDKFA